MAQRAEVVALEELQVLQEHWALAPGAALQNLYASIRGAHGVANEGAGAAEFGEVLDRQQS